MPRGYRLGERSFERTEHAVQWVERQPTFIPAPGIRKPLARAFPGDPVLWIDCENNTSPGEAIPPRSAVEIIGGELDADGETIVLQVKKPSADNLPIHKVGITDENEIPDLLDDGVTRGRGFLTFEPTWGDYDDAGTDTDQLGTDTNSFQLTNAKEGFWKYFRNAVSGADIRAYVQRMTTPAAFSYGMLVSPGSGTFNDTQSSTVKLQFGASSDGGSSGVTVDTANDQLVIDTDGTYLLACFCTLYPHGTSFSNHSDVTISITVNDTPQTPNQKTTVGAMDDQATNWEFCHFPISFFLIKTLVANDEIEVFYRNDPLDTNSPGLELKYGALMALKLS